jgi:hypothetical protein
MGSHHHASEYGSNCSDVTAERVGTIFAIVGATAAGKATKPG